LFSIGIFAVKSGVGMAYLVAGQEKKRAKAGVFLLFALTYGLVFVAADILLNTIDPVRHLAAIQSFIRSGMVVHLLLAGLLTVWGILLLKGGRGHQKKSKGWLLLVVPCPVCGTVILFSAGFLFALFPEAPTSAVLVLYLAFVSINLITMGLIGLYQNRRAGPAASFLGGAMLLMALYFIVSMTVMPQFADVEKIYRLALYQGQAPAQKVAHLLPFSLLAGTAFACGYGFKSKKMRGQT
jgi:predicted transporter